MRSVPIQTKEAAVVEMKTASITFIIGFLVLSMNANYVVAEDSITQKLQPFFQQHCIRCHGPRKEQGGLRIDQLSASLDDLGSVEHLQNILDEITVDAMPPEDEPRPTRQELAKVIPLLTEHVKAATKQSGSGGSRPVRRMTKIEYANTMFDLMGVRIDNGSIPDDGAIGGFDTKAQALFTTDMYVENYMEVARDAVRRFIASRSEKPGQKKVGSQKPSKKAGKFSLDGSAAPAAGYLKARFACWIETPQSKPIFIGPNGSKTFEVTGSRSNPRHIERIFYQAKKEVWKKNKAVGMGDIQYIQVVNPQPYLFFRSFVERYGRGDPPDKVAIHLIKPFVKLMNRGREVDPILIDGLEQQFIARRKRGEPFWGAIVEPMALAMCTIETMFHLEDKDPGRTSRDISGVEFANRLSYLLWRSGPDEELLKLALSGGIHVPRIKSQQIERMMKDAKFERFVRDFSVQWLELERQDLIAVDDLLFRDFDSSAKSSLKEETVQFMLHVFREDLPIRNLIDSDFVLVNNVMARHYGMAEIHGDQFRVVPLPRKSKRGGLLTQAGILMQTGTGDRTSIVERGAFVSRKMLNVDPPPPPPLVNDLPTGGEGFSVLTGADLVRRHAKAPQCASCHNKIDPLGVGLEEFDAIGLHRVKDLRIDPKFYEQNKRARRRLQNLTFEVDLETRGKMPNGKRFQGSEGLKTVLHENQHRLAQAYVEALLTFATGRKTGITDKATVEDIVHRAEKAAYPIRSILKAVVESTEFRTN